MRSDRSIPDSPWPHDMTITVEDRPHALLELLWLREAYDLEIEGDVPGPLVDTPEPAEHRVEAADRARCAREWPRLWRSAAGHVGQEHDPELFSQLLATPDGSPERAELLTRMTGPSARDEVGDEAFDDPSHRAWDERLFDAHVATRPRALADSPERRDLDVLVVAWHAGLTKVVTIPCRGTYTRRLGAHGLLVTAETRADSGAYRRALQSWA